MALIIRADSMLPLLYLEIRIIYMYLYSFIINKLNLNIMIQLEKSSRSQNEIDLLFEYFAKNDPITDKYQWTGTVWIGKEDGKIILTAPVEQYDDNGIIETLDWVSIPVPPEFQ